MTYGDIVRSVTGTLQELFPTHNIYSMARVERLERPAFFFSLKPVIVEASNKRTRHNVLSLYIDYFQAVKDEADMYDAATRIRDALGWSYAVGDNGEYINVTEFDWDFVGSERNIIEMNITLEYFDAIDNDEHAPLIEDVDVTYHLREEYK
jgi:hypothetical protein